MSNWNPNNSLSDSFFNVAKTVYEGDPNYIPEDEPLIRWLFSHENPFFESGKAWVSQFGTTARLAGFVHPDYGHTKAHFGFWESQNDLTVNQVLFSDFEQWAAEQGCSEISGPINFSTFFTYRVRLNEFQTLPNFPREPYNPAYYPELMESLGYWVSEEYFSDVLSVDEQIMTPIPHFLESVETTYRILPLSKEVWTRESHAFSDAVQRIFSSKSFYTPSLIKLNDVVGMEFVGNSLCPESSFYAVDKMGNIVGFYIIFPHYGSITQQGALKPIPVAKVRFAEHYNALAPKIGLIKTVGVVPEHSQTGLIFALWLHAYNKAKVLYPDGIWAALTSSSSRRILSSTASRRSVRYGVFSKSIV
ncbi:hypothetical protein EBR96_02725 [bacterium]|nr:hypothetical protein [bacterium]